IGHLNATKGLWNGQPLLNPAWLRGHGGGNECGLSGESSHFTAMGVVTTSGLRPNPMELPWWHCTTTTSFIPEELFVGPVRVRTGREGSENSTAVSVSAAPSTQ